MRSHRRALSRCLLPPLLALVCFPVVLLVVNQPPVRHRPLHNQELLQNSSWTNEGFHQRMEARMAWRRRHLRAACTRLGLDIPGNDSLHRPNPWEFLISRRYHLIWCNVFKAASTSWMYNFNVLAGYKPVFLRRSNVVPLQLARRRYPRPSLSELQAALNDSLAFLIVRHPFERLLSAYRDKIQYALPNTPHQKLGNDIIQKYRHTKKSKSAKILKSRPTNNPRWPTFPEFVQYLVDVQHKGDSLDMHWIPMTEFCTPCQIDFDVIAKFETLQEDQKYLIDIAGVRNIIKPEWKNPSKGRVTKELMNNYYSQLTITQMLQLYNIYRFDFELFGYSLDEYIQQAKPDSHMSPAPESSKP
ncbi:carbohydrate sulfotransferase 11-like [Lycorma delicatula]|uniref:carbohydrate sulfotransferase 11-like n=1 Tax=Lycorma delicatula TaxID=130591 RepID=UPI003F5159AE